MLSLLIFTSFVDSAMETLWNMHGCSNPDCLIEEYPPGNIQSDIERRAHRRLTVLFRQTFNNNAFFTSKCQRKVTLF